MLLRTQKMNGGQSSLPVLRPSAQPSTVPDSTQISAHDPTINSAIPYFNNLGWTSALQYYPVQKVGITTGWTRGGVTTRCADVIMPSAPIWLTCQDRGTYYVAGGDSGSPVSIFGVDNPDDIYYTGIHWGIHQYLWQYSAWYSPMTQVIGEYGTGGMAIVF